MTIKELSILIGILNKEIENGIDIEFNKNWIRCIKNSIKKNEKRNKI